MARGFAAALDECLAAMSAGESLDECLARYPRYAEELRTHLPLAQRLTMTPRHQPRAAVQEAAWQRFRSQASDMRLGRRPPLSFAWLRPLAIAAVLVLAVLGVAGGGAYASQDALPDSPLYRVKLLTEDARVWVTFDDSRKAELLLNQSNERTDEVMAMLRAGKPIQGNVLSALRERTARAVRILENHPDELALLARVREQSAEQEDLLLVLWGDIAESARDEYAEVVATLHNVQLRTSGTPGSVRPDDLAAGIIHIRGSAELVAEGVWLLGGVEVRIDRRTRGDNELEPGQMVRVVAARGSDGRLLALEVTAVSDGPPDQQYIVSGTLEDVGDGEVVIAGQRIAITTRTLLKLQLQRGQRVEIRVDDIDGQAVASSVEGSTGDRDEEASALLAYEGIIEGAVSTDEVSNDWVVGGQKFTVTPSTEIDARSGVLVEGARARVEAVVENGDVIAKRVVILADEDDADADIVRIEGVLEAGDDESWTVSGIEIVAPADVETPVVGSLVTLEGRLIDGHLVLEKLVTTFTPGRSGLALIRGTIGRIEESGAWQIGLLRVEIPDEAFVLGEPQVGSRVFIWGSRDDEDSLQAVYVNILSRTPVEPPASED
ncbi:MAG: hypothetical protein IIA91_04660 [Chloroflexi bacterium]|nr:hypothetical protein [Chloroflexota bacterium]